MSASGRSRRASAEKMPVGFGAAKIRKKSSSQNAGRRLQVKGCKLQENGQNSQTAPASARPATEKPPSQSLTSAAERPARRLGLWEAATDAEAAGGNGLDEQFPAEDFRAMPHDA